MSGRASSSAESHTRRGKAGVDRSKGVCSDSGYWTDNLGISVEPGAHNLLNEQVTGIPLQVGRETIRLESETKGNTTTHLQVGRETIRDLPLAVATIYYQTCCERGYADAIRMV